MVDFSNTSPLGGIVDFVRDKFSSLILLKKLQERRANTQSKIQERKRKLLELSHKILEVIIAQEVQRKSGMAIQTEEEQLSAQLEALNNQLRAPQQFRGTSGAFNRVEFVQDD